MRKIFLQPMTLAEAVKIDNPEDMVVIGAGQGLRDIILEISLTDEYTVASIDRKMDNGTFYLTLIDENLNKFQATAPFDTVVCVTK